MFDQKVRLYMGRPLGEITKIAMSHMGKAGRGHLGAKKQAWGALLSGFASHMNVATVDRLNPQTNKQASKQANKQTNKQTRKKERKKERKKAKKKERKK